MADKEPTPAREPEVPIKVKNEWFERLVRDPAVQSVQVVKWPAKIGYWIGWNMLRVEERSKFYFTRKQELVKQFAELDEKGNIRTERDIPDGPVLWSDRKGFDEALKELLDTEVPLEGVKLVEVDFGDERIRKLDVQPAEWKVIMPFIKLT